MNAPEGATVVCITWRPFERNTLKGFADLWLRTARLNIHGCAVHEKNGKRWITHGKHLAPLYAAARAFLLGRVKGGEA